MQRKVTKEQKKRLKELADYTRESKYNVKIMDVLKYYPEFDILYFNSDLCSLESKNDQNMLMKIYDKYIHTAIAISREQIMDGNFIIKNVELSSDMKEYILKYMEEKGYKLYLITFKALARQLIDGELLLG